MAKKKPVREIETRTAGGLVRRTTYLPVPMAEGLRQLSEGLVRPESDLIRDAVREYLQRHEVP
jgi:predicted DNA-binding protein